MNEYPIYHLPCLAGRQLSDIMNEYPIYCLPCLAEKRRDPNSKPKTNRHLPFGENCLNCNWTQTRQCCVYYAKKCICAFIYNMYILFVPLTR